MLGTKIAAAVIAVSVGVAGMMGIAPAQKPDAGPEPTDQKSGYLAAAFDGEYFYAAGTGGRLERISDDGRVEALDVPVKEDILCLLAGEDGTLLAGTEGGNALLYQDGEMTSCFTGVAAPIYGLAEFQGRYYAAMGGGYILGSERGNAWQASQRFSEEAICGIASTPSMVLAITAQGDLIQSSDGRKWETSNFNETYEGYYDPLIFRSIRSLGSSVFLAAQYRDELGEPFVASTQDGKLWLQKPLSKISGDIEEGPLDLYINAIGANLDQILAVCNGGDLLTITECSTCNTMNHVMEGDIYDLAFDGENLLVVGEDYEFALLDQSVYRQYQISPEQTQQDIRSGVLAVDVRTPEEYAGGHIPGAVNIPLDQLEKQLPQYAPDQNAEVIFYCGTGGRAQQALEKALAMGYQLVYTMGGIQDWPYELEPAA